MAPREDRIVILTTGSRTTRAGHGIHELLQKPSVQVSTRAAKRVNNGNGESEWIVGEELDKMIARHDSVNVIYPIRGGRVGDWQALIAIWRHVLFQLLGIRTARNDSPILISLPPTLTRETLAIATESIFDVFNAPGLCIAEEPQVSAYAAGVLTATVIDIGWEHCTITPVSEQNGVVNHAVTRSDVGLRHVAIYLAFLLSKDESVVQALITLNARRNAREESEGGNNSSDQLAVRLFELAVHLIGQGKVKTTLQGEGYANQVAREDEAEAEFDIAAALVAGREKAAVEEQERRNKAALEASNREADQGLAPTAQGQDVLLTDKSEIQVGASKEEGAETVQFQGITIKVGPAPLSQACEPLWDPSVLSVLRGKLASSATSSLGPLDLGSMKMNSDYNTLRSLPSSIASSITAAGEPEKRAQLWETLLATGAPVRLLQNFSSVLVAACQSSCLASSRGADQGSGATSALAGGGSGGISRESPGIGGLEDTSQPTNARCIKTPDYFAEFKDRTDLAPFLGATIYAKLAFTDPYGRLVTSKAVYNEKGPSATFLVSAPS